MWFRRPRRVLYGIQTAHLSREQEIASCRAALQLVAEHVHLLQIDVPWDNAASWPDEVVKAALVFVPRRKGYEGSGWITPVDGRQWQAFCTLAPYSFSSDAWTIDRKMLANVNDEGTSISVHVPVEELGMLREAVAPARVVV